ncbi:copper-transporting ATPase [Aspergillus luchuensis]|uniref:Copper-transporting ATPase n=1 Tax=Aspergillus kawachii TaxID=1069201 RepID=A0A146FYV1_ASPKA|nr:copper-transporting ATPase [Aspergillus luchuensis]
MVVSLTITSIRLELIHIALRLSSSLFLLLFGGLCYLCNFDKSLKQHPRYHKNQIWEEAQQSLLTLFLSTILTVPILLTQVRGYAKLYDFGDCTVSATYEVAQVAYFIIFSDTYDNRQQFHTVHHKNVQRNFGQYLDIWDRIAGTYADPGWYLRGKADVIVSSK